MISYFPDLSWGSCDSSLAYGFKLSVNPCTWEGFSCSISMGLYELDLTEISALSIPSYIGQLRNLTVLSISDSSISGPIPASIGNLQRLKTLDLSYNKLTGSIPVSLCSCVHLESLILRNNKLSGTIPESIGSLVHLSTLELDENYLTGSITPLRNCTYLETVSLSSNLLNGSIPAFGTQLTYLNLNDNQLTGTLPSALFRQRQGFTISIYIQYNKLSGALPEFPYGPSLSSFSSLYLDGNKLSGKIPHSIANAALSATKLSLSSNNFSGTLSPLSTLNKLQLLNLSTNNFTGDIPSFFGSFSNLVTLNLDNNQLGDEEIDNSLCDAKSLGELTLTGNSFGCFPVCLSVTSVDFTDTMSHCPSGEDAALCDLSDAFDMKTVISEHLVITEFTYESDHSLSADNDLSPTVLTVSVKSAIFYWVSFDSRSFTYLSAKTIVICSSEATPCSDSDLLYTLSPKLPSDLPGVGGTSSFAVKQSTFYIMFLSNGMKLTTWGYRLVVTAHSPAEGWSCTTRTMVSNGVVTQSRYASRYCSWFGVSCAYGTAVTSLTLSALTINGKIPDTIGNLVKLKSLDLSCNKIHGRIPSFIGNLTFLSYLDLTTNRLTGQIPNSIPNLPYLAYFAVGDNQLSGTVPIMASSYISIAHFDANLFSGKLIDSLCESMSISKNSQITITLNPDLTCYEPCWQAYASKGIFDSSLIFCAPTSQPSSRPTLPTSQPSRQPSAIPSQINPTSQPSTYPTRRPIALGYSKSYSTTTQTVRHSSI